MMHRLETKSLLNCMHIANAGVKDVKVKKITLDLELLDDSPC